MTSGAVELTVPNLGASVESATIVAWSKQAGDFVATDEPICRLAINELQFEVCSTADGELSHLFAVVGDGVRSGDSLAEVTPIAVPQNEPAPEPEPFYTTEPPGAIAEPEPEPATPIDLSHAEPLPPLYPVPEPKFEPVVVAEPDPEPEIVADPQPEPALVIEPEPEQAVVIEPDAASEAEPSSNGGRPESIPSSEEGVDWARWHSPVVRKLAEENDIDLADVEGTGTGGRIRKRDVLAQIQ